MKPASWNAFDIISLSNGFDLSSLLEMEQKQKVHELFMTQKPASAVSIKARGDC
jgi:5'-AMP-activated protein kinase catalytic alpha subunit